MIKRLKADFNVYQLDATAYPGNSGSPVYDPGTGQVLAILSSVFVKQTKEKILADPSGITFAIPIRYARELVERAVSGEPDGRGGSR
jgi:S1-C subfamily serine protease